MMILEGNIILKSVRIAHKLVRKPDGQLQQNLKGLSLVCSSVNYLPLVTRKDQASFQLKVL